MRRAPLVLVGTALLAAAAWVGCYSLSSDCDLLVSCGNGGAGGAGGASSSSASSTSSSTTSSTSSSTTSSTSGSTTSSTSGSTTSSTSSSTTSSTSGSTTTSTTTTLTTTNAPLGTACTVGADCASGHCVESVCCADAACGSCTSCALPGHAGTCTGLPVGADDNVNHCEGSGICDVAPDGGVLVEGGAPCTGTSLGHFGDPCTTGTDCFNGVCQAGLCKLALGDPCFYDATCASGLCSGNVCTACATDTDCPFGHCNPDVSDAGASDAGICGLGGGDTCAVNTDCADQSCGFLHYCSPPGSQTCTPASCPFHACPGGICASCSTAADCPLSTPCTNGNCLAPPGAFCTQAGAAMCASGMCPPPAFLDFRRCK